jgi:hypothetical protein
MKNLKFPKKTHAKLYQLKSASFGSAPTDSTSTGDPTIGCTTLVTTTSHYQGGN